MITLTVVSKVMPGKEEEFLQIVRSLTTHLDKKANSTNFKLYQKVDDQTVFNLVCDLGTREELKKLLSGEEFRVLLGAFKVLCEKSKIRCRYICQNLPRHACTIHETLGRKSVKKVDRKARGPKSLQRSDES